MATTPRFTGAKNKDNTGRVEFRDFQNPVYAATLNLAAKPNASHTLVQLLLTGACTINIAVGTSTTAPFVGDTMQIQVVSDGSSRTITWGTGVAPAVATFVVTTAKYGIVNMTFNGTAWVASTVISA